MGSMFMPEEYYRPKTVDDAFALLTKHGGRAKLMAGGTDLLVDRPSGVECLIDIKGLPLSYITSDGAGGVRIGALTTFHDVENSPLLREGAFMAVAEAARRIGHPNLRNLATVGGNICNAVPSADATPSLMALDATAKIVGPGGERIVPLEDFFIHVRKTILRDGELLAEVRIPRPPHRTGTAFLKVGRTSADIALVNAAARISLGEGGVFEEVRIALGAVAPTPIRARRAEKLLVGKMADEGLIRKAAEAASEETKPISDVRTTADYRRELSAVLVKRALERSWERAVS